jgi:hydroxymethylpyrimidine/phosphomethylpyrimidine kinase
MEAQEYTWNALNSAYQPGRGQFIPNRFFWMEEDA